MKKGALAPNLKLSLPPPDDISKFLYFFFFFPPFIYINANWFLSVGVVGFVSFQFSFLLWFGFCFWMYAGLVRERLRTVISWLTGMGFGLSLRLKLKLYEYYFFSIPSISFSVLLWFLMHFITINLIHFVVYRFVLAFPSLQCYISAFACYWMWFGM